jgi:polysaccharide pyruvyl transferase WcaK-like protein
MVEYRPKCRDFMASIDMERFNVRTDQFNAEIGKKLVEEMYNDLESIRIKGNKICLDYRSKLIEAAQTVNKIIKA